MKPPHEPESDLPAAIHHDIGAEADFVEGELKAIEVDDREVGVARLDGRLHAASLRCTHAAWLMRDVPLEGVEIVCSLHGARFDLRDGCPTAGPAQRPLDTYPVRVRAGRVEIEMPPRPPGPRRRTADGC